MSASCTVSEIVSVK